VIDPCLGEGARYRRLNRLSATQPDCFCRDLVLLCVAAQSSGLLLSDESAIAKLLLLAGGRGRITRVNRSERATPMSGPALRPRVARLDNGRWRAEVAILHPWGDESVYRGGVAASEGEALEAARRLVAAATAEPVPICEVPAAWK
jgi:hypothetical protein